MKISALIFEHFHRFQGIRCCRETRSLLGSEPSAIIGNNVQSTRRKINSSFRVLKARSGNSGASQFRVVASDEDPPISIVSGVRIIKLSGLDLSISSRTLASLLSAFSRSSSFKRQRNTVGATVPERVCPNVSVFELIGEVPLDSLMKLIL